MREVQRHVRQVQMAPDGQRVRQRPDRTAVALVFSGVFLCCVVVVVVMHVKIILYFFGPLTGNCRGFDRGVCRHPRPPPGDGEFGFFLLCVFVCVLFCLFVCCFFVFFFFFFFCFFFFWISHQTPPLSERRCIPSQAEQRSLQDLDHELPRKDWCVVCCFVVVFVVVFVGCSFSLFLLLSSPCSFSSFSQKTTTTSRASRST